MIRSLTAGDGDIGSSQTEEDVDQHQCELGHGYNDQVLGHVMVGVLTSDPDTPHADVSDRSSSYDEVQLFRCIPCRFCSHEVRLGTR